MPSCLTVNWVSLGMFSSWLDPGCLTSTYWITWKKYMRDYPWGIEESLFPFVQAGNRIGANRFSESSRNSFPEHHPPEHIQHNLCSYLTSTAEAYGHSPKSTEEFHLIKFKPPPFSLMMYTNVLRWKFATTFPSEGCRKASLHHTHNCFNGVLASRPREAAKKSETYYAVIRAGRAIIRNRGRASEDPKLVAHYMIRKI